jgi:lysophospholipase L1-like esterase
MHPKLATVWLGGNDILKYIESHGQSPATDSPTQYASDLQQIITTLQKGGAQVVVADLPDILGHPHSGEPPIATFIAQTSLAADLEQLGVPAALAVPTASYVQTTYTKGPGGFVLINGVLSIVSQLQQNPAAPVVLDPAGPGSGDGQVYLDQTFAAQAIALNDAYNQTTDAVATATGAALAPVTSTFVGLSSTGVPLAPGVTLTTRYGGGIFSFDGVHPSDTGYALVANLFIQAADTKYSLTIPPVTAAEVGGIASADPYNPFVIKTLDPAYPLPFNQ